MVCNDMIFTVIQMCKLFLFLFSLFSDEFNEWRISSLIQGSTICDEHFCDNKKLLKIKMYGVLLAFGLQLKNRNTL